MTSRHGSWQLTGCSWAAGTCTSVATEPADSALAPMRRAFEWYRALLVLSFTPMTSYCGDVEISTCKYVQRQTDSFRACVAGDRSQDWEECSARGRHCYIAGYVVVISAVSESVGRRITCELSSSWLAVPSCWTVAGWQQQQLRRRITSAFMRAGTYVA